MPNKPTISPDLRDLELNALLEVTEAINNNLSEESLYKIYRFTLLAGLKVKKLALFVKGKIWDCKVQFGIPDDFCEKLDVEKYANLEGAQKIGNRDEASRLFQLAIPVRHKDKLLAVVFVGEMSEEIMSTALRSSTTFLEALTNIILVAIENKKLARKQLEQEAIRKELEIAKQVQQFLFPKNLPATEKLVIDAFYQPHHNVGGDYYDYLQISENKFLVCIADVSGKGVPAALMMSNFQASLRTLVRQTQDLELIVKELNFQLCGSGNAEIFITFFVAIYDYRTQALNYVNCGHNPPMMIADDVSPVTLEKGTTVMGMFDPLPFFEQGAIDDLKSFDLLLYTDGLSETMNEHGDELGEERISKLFMESHKGQPAALNEGLMQLAEDFREGVPYRDDITLMTIKVRA